jgi:uncharacterized membrane protein YphA (DoxX/SURF4 family)
MRKRLIYAVIYLATILTGLGLFGFVGAHEVYVLPNGRAQYDRDQHSPDIFTALDYKYDQQIFAAYLMAIFVGIGIVYYLTKHGFLAKALRRFLKQIKIYAPTIARVFIGLSFIYGSHYNALFGPEVPLSELGAPHLLQWVLMVCGAMLLVGIFSRVAAVIGLVIYFYALSIVGVYLTSYINYLAEFILIIVAGGGVLSVDSLICHVTGKENKAAKFEKKYGGLILRLGLGIALLFAAINIKILHSQLSLDVISQYHLTKYFPFDPLFVVLGAALVEIAIALFYIFGLMVRLNTIIFLSFITASLLFFGEAVWPHLILFGISLAIFAYGYDRYTLEAKVFDITGHEPVL